MSNIGDGHVVDELDFFTMDGLNAQAAIAIPDSDDCRMEEIFSKEDEIICRVIDLFPEVQIHKIHLIMGSVTTIYAEKNPDNADDATAKICHYLLENPDLFKADQESNEHISNEDDSIGQDQTRPNSIDRHTFSEDTIYNESYAMNQDTNLNEPCTLRENTICLKSDTYRQDTNSNELRLLSEDIKTEESHTISEDTKTEVNITLSEATKPEKSRTCSKVTTSRDDSLSTENTVMLDLSARYAALAMQSVDSVPIMTDKSTTLNENAILTDLAEDNSDLYATSDTTEDSEWFRSLIGPDELYCPCLCCFDDIPFDQMVQCQSGHLFCRQCLERYVRESVFGEGKLELKCMTADCGVVFPHSEVHRVIPIDLYNKYQERVMEEGINSAALDDLVRCKNCPYGVVMDSEELFFMCPTCEITYCRKCQRSYEEHQGVDCNQIEEKGETQIRKQYEEKMAEAKIRTCGRCKTRFTKDKGCNHIQCRCGASMCYVCRVPNVNKKKHYCRHVRESGRSCYECNKRCYLYTDVDEDDEMAIAELKSEAEYVRHLEGFSNDKEIGAPVYL